MSNLPGQLATEFLGMELVPEGRPIRQPDIWGQPSAETLYSFLMPVFSNRREVRRDTAVLFALAVGAAGSGGVGCGTTSSSASTSGSGGGAQRGGGASSNTVAATGGVGGSAMNASGGSSESGGSTANGGAGAPMAGSVATSPNAAKAPVVSGLLVEPNPNNVLSCFVSWTTDVAASSEVRFGVD